MYTKKSCKIKISFPSGKLEHYSYSSHRLNFEQVAHVFLKECDKKSLKSLTFTQDGNGLRVDYEFYEPVNISVKKYTIKKNKMIVNIDNI